MQVHPFLLYGFPFVPIRVVLRYSAHAVARTACLSSRRKSEFLQCNELNAKGRMSQTTSCTHDRGMVHLFLLHGFPFVPVLVVFCYDHTCGCTLALCHERSVHCTGSKGKRQSMCMHHVPVV